MIPNSRLRSGFGPFPAVAGGMGRAMGMPAGVPSGAFDGTTIFDILTAFDPTITTNSGGWEGYTFVTRIANAQIASGGNRMRLTLKAGTGSLTISEAYAGIAAASGPGFLTSGVPIRLGGSPELFVGANKTVKTDWFSLVQNGSSDLCFAFQCPASPTSAFSTAATTGCLGYYKLGADAETSAKTSYTTYTTNCTGIDLIEVA